MTADYYLPTHATRGHHPTPPSPSYRPLLTNSISLASPVVCLSIQVRGRTEASLEALEDTKQQLVTALQESRRVLEAERRRHAVQLAEAEEESARAVAACEA